MILSLSNYRHTSTAVLVLLLVLNYNLYSQIQWAGDTNLTGDIYRAGNVGIGTTTPSAKLEINTATTQLRLHGDGNIYGYDINVNKTNGWARNYSFSSNGETRAHLGALGSGDILTYLYFNTDYDATDPIGYKDPEMVIRENGNVGIGITDPNSLLHIKGTVGTNGHLQISGLNNTDGATIALRDGSGLTEGRWNLELDGTDHRFAISTRASGSWEEAMSILGNGNIGIGTTSPGTYKLAVEGTIGARSVKVTSGQLGRLRVCAPLYLDELTGNRSLHPRKPTFAQHPFCS